MDLIHQSGKKYLFITRNKCFNKPISFLKYTLFKVVDKQHCLIISTNELFKTEWYTENIEKSILNKIFINKIENINNLLLFRIVEHDSIFYYDIYLNVNLTSEIIEKSYNFLSQLIEDFNIFEKIQENYFQNLRTVNLDEFYKIDNDLNKKVNIYSIKYPLKENQHKSLKWMIEKENLGNRYLNPNIEYIPLSGSKYFLKAGDYSMLYNHNYNVDSYFKCFGGILASGSKSGKTLVCLALCDNTLNRQLEIPMIPEREFYIKLNATLIIVPNELLQYWVNEIYKFFGEDYSYKVIDSKVAQDTISYDTIKNVKIILSTYKFIDNKLSSDNGNEIKYKMQGSNKSFLQNNGIKLNAVWWNRIIYDEYQNIITNKNDVNFNLKSHFKWCVSSTPNLISDISYLKTLKLLDVSGINNPLLCKENFIKNCVWLSRNCEYNKINENIIKVDLSDNEMNFYKFLKTNLEKYNENDFLKVIKKMIKLDGIHASSDLKNIEKENNKIINESIKRKEKQVEHQKKVNMHIGEKKIVDNYLNKLNESIDDLNNMNSYFKNTIKNLSVNTNNNEKCAVCFSNFENKHCITMCGHIFCYECINSIMIQNNQNAKCPECRRLLNNKIHYYNYSDENIYSSRIKSLLKFLENSEKKFILVVDNESTTKIINDVLQKNNILCSTTKTIIDNDKFIGFNSNKIKVITIPYYKLDFIVGILNCSDIVLFHPPYTEEYIRIEKLLYSRIKTSNISNTNIYRFILKDTYEEHIKYKLN
jgi:hypothetical protein